MRHKDYTYPLLLSIILLYVLFAGSPDVFDILKFKLMTWAGYDVCN